MAIKITIDEYDLMVESLEPISEPGPISRISSAPDVDPYFEVVGRSGLMHDEKPATDYHSTLKYLLSNIKREPLNMQLHVQRINLLLDLEDGVGLKAALVDLYIALGHRGYALKLRMLSLIRPFLEPINYQSFMLTIYSGLEAHNPVVGDLPGVMLSEGFMGRAKLLVRVSEESTLSDHEK
jgi:hypothetical protein